MRCSTVARSQAVRFKVDLPNYGVFDEKRVFDAGPLPGPINLPRRQASAFRSARTSGPRRSRNASPECGGEILHGPERLALPDCEEDRRAA
jgi:hypothetical protein